MVRPEVLEPLMEKPPPPELPPVVEARPPGSGSAGRDGVLTQVGPLALVGRGSGSPEVGDVPAPAEPGTGGTPFGKAGSDGAGRLGRPELPEGRAGADGAAGGVMHRVAPLVDETVSEPPPPAIDAEPPPEPDTGSGFAGGVGVLTHRVPVGRPGAPAVGRDGAALLGRAPPMTIASPATPAALPTILIVLLVTDMCLPFARGPPAAVPAVDVRGTVPRGGALRPPKHNSSTYRKVDAPCEFSTT